MLNKRKVKILIADDIFSNQLLVKSIIELAGYSCKVVANGKLLIEELIKDEYDIVFTDIEMPVMNGIETVKYIRTHLNFPIKDIPVIAITAHNLSEFSRKIFESGFSDIITKPYAIEKFKKILTKYLPSEE